jgi:hypothetical protein
MASDWKTKSTATTLQVTPVSALHVLAPLKILITHFGAQTPTGVGRDLLSDKNCSSSWTTSIQAQKTERKIGFDRNTVAASSLLNLAILLTYATTQKNSLKE